MDPFTENILARARERQKMLQGYSGQDKGAPLRESNKNAVSEPNLTEASKMPPKEVRSETNIPSRYSPNKENASQGLFTRQNSITRVSSDIQGSPGSQTKTLNIQRDNFNMEIKVKSSDNVRLEVEIEEQDFVEDNSDNSSQKSENGGLREESRNRLKRLGKLYAGGDEPDISSPIHRTEAKFYQSIENENQTEINMNKNSRRDPRGLSKLANLADTINQWEDDLHHVVLPSSKKPSSPRKTWKPPAPQPPVEKETLSQQKPAPSRALKPKAPNPPEISTNSPKKSLFQRGDTFVINESDSLTSGTCNPAEDPPSSPRKASTEARPAGYISPTKNGQSSPRKWGPSSPTKSESPRKQFGSPMKDDGALCVGATPKKINWDKKVLDTLESQGYTRTQSSSRLIYSYTSQEQTNLPSEKLDQISEAHIEVKNICVQGETTQKSERSPQKNGIVSRGNEQSNEPAQNSHHVDSQAKNFRSGGIANRAAMFEQKALEAPVKISKDPALLSLSERKALFEKNKGEALVPKAAFGMSAPVKVDTVMKASESKLIGATKPKENAFQASKSIFENKETSEYASENLKTSQHASRGPPKPSSASSKGKHPAPPPPPVVESKVAPPKTTKITPRSNMNTPTVAVVHQSGGIASKMAALLENKNKSTISEEQIASKVKEERQKEIDMLLNRFNRNKETVANQDAIDEVYSDEEGLSEDEIDESDERTAMLKEKPAKIVTQNARKSAEKRKSGNRLSTEADSPRVVSVIEEVKRIKVSPPKAGRLYPNLSDIEATTTDHETRTPTPNEENSDRDDNYDSDDPNTSFGRDILQTVCKNITPVKKASYKDSSSGSENSSVMDELDEILEEMEDDNSSVGPTPPKQGRHHSPKSKYSKPQQSNSFHYKSFTSTSSGSSPSQKFQSPKKTSISPRQSTELPVVVDGDEVLTLTHTVSFYRKQQNEVHTPVRQIIRQPIIEESPDFEKSQDDAVPEKIRELQREVNKQQNIISQTSQALNLCSSTPEFSGSTEQVEAERVLLVATHRRQAALHELQRLKVEGTIRPLSQHSLNVPLEKGTLTISNIVVPLKQKYVKALAAAGGKGHHVVCLIKCGEQVVPTKLVSTVASNSKNPDVDLYIPGTVTLNNIYSDFTVTFEVYCLQAQEECLPHEVKYHINKKGLATPKKSKQESRLLRPPKESPAGPQAVRTSSFAIMGYVVFSVQAVNKRVWSLNNTPPMSPLEGSVEMKIHCELAVSVEHRAFLTMFEDVTGFGAWHRRWFLLKGNVLSYWKYPDDERRLPPIDTIDLKTCITKEVKQVSRDICARPHTVLLERERPAYPQDKDTLVIVRKGEKTVIRHLLSADTKEERIEWCKKLNAALTAIRMWGTTQQ